jgi:hypothetical protein
MYSGEQVKQKYVMSKKVNNIITYVNYTDCSQYSKY